MKTSRSSLLISGSILLLIIALGAVQAFIHRNYEMDDSYITFCYARNLINGNGFVLNPGERVQGTTTPLFTFLIAVSLLFFPDPQKTSVALSILPLVAIALLAVRFFQQRGSWLAGSMVAILVLLSPLNMRSVTMETGFYTFLLILFMVLKHEGKDRLAAFVAALAFLTRFDGVLLYPLALLCRREGKLRLVPPATGLILAIPTLAWLFFAKLYFGSFLPNTFYSKSATLGTDRSLLESLFSPTGRDFITGLPAWGKHIQNEQTFFFGVFLLLALIGLGLELRQERPLWIAPWICMYFVGYVVINPSWRFHWYFVPLFAALTFVLGNLVLLIGKWRLRYRVIAAVVVLLPLAPATVSFAKLVAQPPDYPAPFLRDYRRIAEYVALNSPPDARIAVSEIGVVAYFSGRRIIDLVGLTSTTYQELVRAVGPEAAKKQILLQERPEYIVLTIYGGYSATLAEYGLADEYQPVIDGRKGRRSFSLFAKQAAPK